MPNAGGGLRNAYTAARLKPKVKDNSLTNGWRAQEMGEARRRAAREASNLTPATGDAFSLSPELEEALKRLSAWNDEFRWAQPPAAEQDVPESEVMFYLVDTLTLWNVVGGISESSATKLFELAEQSPASLYQRAPGLVGLNLLKASMERAQLHDETTQNALTMAGLYLACTETYSQIRARDSLRGHWFVLLYHLQDGSRTVRPFFGPGVFRQKLSPAEHASLVVEAVGQDLHGDVTELSKRIQDAGGLRLAAPLKHRVVSSRH